MGRADPNSQEPRSTVVPGSSPGATYPGSRYGKGGASPSADAGDASEACKVVDASPGVG